MEKEDSRVKEREFSIPTLRSSSIVLLEEVSRGLDNLVEAAKGISNLLPRLLLPPLLTNRLLSFSV